MRSIQTLKATRRTLLRGAAASVTLLAFHLPVYAANEPEQVPGGTAGKFAPNAFIRIAKDGKTTRGRPADVKVAKDGSALIADDTGGVIWRVAKAG